MRVRVLPTLLLLFAFSLPAIAQSASASSLKMLLQDGTPLKLRLSRNLSSADAKTGEQVDFEVLENIKVADLVVIAKGGVAMGTVTEAQAKRRMGRAGKLSVTLDYVRLVSSEKAALRTAKEVAGGSRAGAANASMVPTSLIVWPAAPLFVFIHGEDITIPKGTEITAYTNGDMELTRAKFEPNTPAVAPAGVAAASAPVAAPSPTCCSPVLVSSNPSGAEIELDGSFVGSTPSIINMASGDHQIVLKKKAFKPWERKIKATGGSVKVEAELEPAPR